MAAPLNARQAAPALAAGALALLVLFAAAGPYATLGVLAAAGAGAWSVHASARARAAERSRTFAAACAALESGVEPAVQSIDDRALRALGVVGPAVDWSLGIWFAVDREGGTWRCARVWRAPGAGRTRFELSIENGAFPRGAALPGRVWASGGPEWLPSLAARRDCETATALALEGFHAASAVPLRAGAHGDVLGVLALFAGPGAAADAGVHALLAFAAAQIERALAAERSAAREIAIRETRAALLSEADRSAAAQRDHESLRGDASLVRALLENGTWGIFTTDAGGTLTSFNATAEAWSGYSAAQVVGKATPVILHDAEEVAARARELGATGRVVPGFPALAAQARDGQPDEREWTWVRRNGTRLSVSVSLCPLRGAGGVVEGFLGVVRDLTERNRVRQELTDAKDAAERASRAKSQFLANMSHELRTPLNSIIGFANILLKNKDEHLDAKELTYLSRVLENGKHLLGLINTILDLSKIEAGSSEVAVAPVNLDRLVREVLAQFEAQTHDRAIKLEVEIPAELEAIDADEVKLRQVLINLVGNALKFTEKGAVTVRIAADPVNRRPLALEVADTGVGIPPDRQEAIFEAFQQADNTTARKYGGTGLGLTITRTLLAQMGYGVELESAPGHGSTFRVRLWRQPESGQKLVTVLSPDEARRLRIAEKLVLVIDDDADSRLLTHRIVQELGARVVSAPSGQWGLELARLNQPEIVILATSTPAGLEVGRELRAEPALRDIPLVLVLPDPAEAKGRVPDVEDYLPRPFDPEVLKAALKRHLFPKRGKILVVDDEQFVTEVLTYALQEKGAEVRTAANGRLALDLLQEYRPDLILLDMLMPVMTGMQFLAEFEKHPRFSQVPVFVFTGKLLTPEEIAEIDRLGARVMIKGEKLDVLLREVFAKLPERRRRDRPHKTVVRVAPKLAHLIPGFLKNRRTDVDQIKSGLAAGDFALIQRLGHQLRGSGGGYGFTDLTDIGHRLEVAASQQDSAELTRSLGALKDYLESVEVIYQ